MRLLPAAALLTITGFGVWASTLQKLTLDEMIDKSTSIVHGRVAGSGVGSFHGATIYTHYTVDVIERWKGALGARLDVVVPGGAAGGQRQVFAGVPNLVEGGEYVLFLWSSPSGLTHIIGLSQGLMRVRTGAAGTPVVTRAASTADMVDSRGRPASDRQLTYTMQDLAARISGRVQGK